MTKDDALDYITTELAKDCSMLALDNEQDRVELAAWIYNKLRLSEKANIKEKNIRKYEPKIT